MLGHKVSTNTAFTPRALAISIPRYYTLEQRALAGLVDDFTGLLACFANLLIDGRLGLFEPLLGPVRCGQALGHLGGLLEPKGYEELAHELESVFDPVSSVPLPVFPAIVEKA